MVRMLREQGRVSNEEFDIRVKSGEIHVWLFSAEPINIGGEPCLISIATDITERKKAEEKMEHLNLVLHAIRNVNQLITKEKDRERLLKGACSELIETLGYYHVWIGLLDKSGVLVPVAQSGLDKHFQALVKQCEHGNLNNCARRALGQSEVVVIEDVRTDCSDCPLVKLYKDRGALSTRLRCGDSVYGMITASIPIAYIQDKEEQMLFKELAGDIAFALQNIELEEERRRTEDALRQSEEFTDSVLKSAPNPLVVINPDSSIKYVNPAFEKLTGFTLAEIAGMKPPQPWWPEEKKKELNSSIKESMGSGGRRVERLFQKKNGERFWVDMNLVPIIYNGTLKYHMANWADITERKKAEEKMEHLNRVLRAIRNVNQLITKEKDRERLLKGACEKLIETLGYYHVWIGLLDKSGVLVPLAESGLDDHFQSLAKQCESGKLSNCARRALGQSEVVVIKDIYTDCGDCPLVRLYNDSGALSTTLRNGDSVYGMITASTPIAYIEDKEEQMLFKELAGDIAFALRNIELEEERQRTEKALRESEEKFSKAFRSSPDAIAITTIKDGRFIEVNDSYPRLTGYTREEVIGHSATEFGIWARAEDRARMVQILKERGRVE